MATTKKKKTTLMDNMPSREVIEEGRQILADLMKLLDENNLFLIFDPDDYSLRLGPDGLTYPKNEKAPKGKIPYTEEEDQFWGENYTLGGKWGEFDPDNFNDK